MTEVAKREYVFFLGRQAEIGAAELWGALEKQGLKPTLVGLLGPALIVQLAAEVNDWSFLNRLGGVERAGKALASVPGDVTAEQIVSALSPLAHKMHFGLSTIGVPNPGRKFLVNMKKLAKAQGCRLNFIEPKAGQARLSSAQVLFNGLYRAPNAEITLIKQDGSVRLVRTMWVQDIEAYEKRDTARPVRDPYVGMLPPKLAQTMISLATAHLRSPATIFDPFCGLGTILQEGWLGGQRMIGSDKEARMIEASRRNLAWVQTLYSLPAHSFPELFVHDATVSLPQNLTNSVDAIVTEPFLGTPLSKPLTPAEAEKFLAELGSLYKQFFRQAWPSLKDTGRLLVAVPAVRLAKAWQMMPQACLDELGAIGYLQEQLVPSGIAALFPPGERKGLLYARPDALIGRELTLWRKV